MTVTRVPIPTDEFEVPSFYMARVHDVVETGLHNILKLLSIPPTDDLGNFLGYCDAWVTILIHHHETEEHMMFPFLNAKLDFSKEEEQHKQIFDQIEKFAISVRAAREDNSKFDAALLLQVLTVVKDLLLPHLHEEVEHLGASHLRGVFSESEVKDMVQDCHKYAMEHEDFYVSLPFIASHTSPEYKSWPPLPWMVAKMVLPWWIARKHSGWWKYAPYSMS
ncbi:hypothetical protein V1509DRAFT_620966 [Lipomyces kononenkoae]